MTITQFLDPEEIRLTTSYEDRYEVAPIFQDCGED